MTFKELKLDSKILKAIELEGYLNPSEIQELAIPILMNNKDVLGSAQTGTGKTAAFALPIIHNLINSTNYDKSIKALVLVPTRELAIQVRDSFRSYSVNTNLKCSVVFGGVNQRSQVELLRKGVDVLVATPGRLLDLINQKYINLSNIKTLVLDEADTMLDMGFIHDVKKIVKFCNLKRQTIMFSATITNEVKKLANEFLSDYEVIEINYKSLTVDKINQSVYFVDKVNKASLLLEILNCDEIKSALVFVRTKHGADKLGEILHKNGINSSVIHGNKSQNARISALNNFKLGKNKVLVATDIAARGIDIIELSHVINFELPENGEVYIHRIGRTARAGLGGSAISLCNYEESSKLKVIEKKISQKISIIDNHNYPATNFVKVVEDKKGSKRSNKRRTFNKRK